MPTASTSIPRAAATLRSALDDQTPHVVPIAALEQRNGALEDAAVAVEQRPGQLRRA
jgi:hypothetical protein